MSVENPVKIENTHGESTKAAVFLHGFTGDGIGTWGTLPQRLQDAPGLGAFDFYFWQYPSELSLKYAITKWVWEDDPDITTLGEGLRSLLHDSILAAHDYDEVHLIAHSMGGLVVQSYVVEELRRIRVGELPVDDSALRKINEIVLYATPSGGLLTARVGRFLKNQIADMSDVGPFVTNLRSEWEAQVDGHLRDFDPDAPVDGEPATDPLLAFRLTAVAGMKDRFVPPESALDPLPFAEHVMVPGNHVELVKPERVGDQPYDVLVHRLTRENPTAEELRVVHGHSADAVDQMRLIEAAVEVGDTGALRNAAATMLGAPATLPTVERALGLALGRQAEHATAVELLRRYLGYTLSNSTQPFAGDAQAIQQLAVAESGLGHHTEAIATLKSLPSGIALAPETLGITAGRIKRLWSESGPPRSAALARRALDTYAMGYEAAVEADDLGQVLYNGINAAFLGFAMDRPYRHLAQHVLDACPAAAAEATAKGENGYWIAATKGEALFLLGRPAEAHSAYEDAFELTVDKRYLASTGLQAVAIYELMGEPAEAAGIAEMFGGFFGGTAGMMETAEHAEVAHDDEELASAHE